mgnify:CR=1 FL=1
MKFTNSNTSQIEGLHNIYNDVFTNITDGFFVEVGGYDGYRWSNTVTVGEEHLLSLYLNLQKNVETDIKITTK